MTNKKTPNREALVSQKTLENITFRLKYDSENYCNARLKKAISLRADSLCAAYLRARV